MARPGESFDTQCTSASLAPATCIKYFTAMTNSGAVDIGFNVKIDGTTYPQVFVNKYGTLTFVTRWALRPPRYDSARHQPVAGANPFIAAFYPSSELVSRPRRAPSSSASTAVRNTAAARPIRPAPMAAIRRTCPLTWPRSRPPGTRIRNDSSGNPLVENPISIASCSTTPRPQERTATSTSAWSSTTLQRRLRQERHRRTASGSGTHAAFISASASTPTRSAATPTTTSTSVAAPVRDRLHAAP